MFQSRKRDGHIVALVSRGAEWSPRPAAEAASDITQGRVRYVVNWDSGPVAVTVSDTGDLEARGPGDRPGGLLLLPDG